MLDFLKISYLVLFAVQRWKIFMGWLAQKKNNKIPFLYIIILKKIVILNKITVMSINSRIRTFREAKGLKQQRMADLLNISQTTYNKIENEQTKIKIDILIKIAEILEVTLDDLVTNDGNTNIQCQNENANINNQPTFNNDFLEMKQLYERLLEAEKTISAQKDKRIQELEELLRRRESN